MNIFNDINLPSKEEQNKFPKLDSWFDFMNSQFEKIEESTQKSKINSLMIDNDIDLIE